MGFFVVVLEPYIKLGEWSLSICENQVEVILGKPTKKSINNIGLIEYNYGSKIFRFASNGDLAEVTADLKTIEINKHNIPFVKLSSFVKTHDKSTFEKFGFIISPEFGLAFDPEFPCWITVLPKAGLALWKEI